jgi:hypothetical protein
MDQEEWLAAPRRCLDQLTPDPGGGGIRGNLEVEKPAGPVRRDEPRVGRRMRSSSSIPAGSRIEVDIDNDHGCATRSHPVGDENDVS